MVLFYTFCLQGKYLNGTILPWYPSAKGQNERSSLVALAQRKFRLGTTLISKEDLDKSALQYSLTLHLWDYSDVLASYTDITVWTKVSRSHPLTALWVGPSRDHINWVWSRFQWSLSLTPIRHWSYLQYNLRLAKWVFPWRKEREKDQKQCTRSWQLIPPHENWHSKNHNITTLPLRVQLSENSPSYTVSSSESRTPIPCINKREIRC